MDNNNNNTYDIKKHSEEDSIDSSSQSFLKSKSNVWGPSGYKKNRDDMSQESKKQLMAQALFTGKTSDDINSMLFGTKKKGTTKKLSNNNRMKKNKQVLRVKQSDV